MKNDFTKSSSIKYSSVETRNQTLLSSNESVALINIYFYFFIVKTIQPVHDGSNFSLKYIEINYEIVYEIKI
jgi:hypothetical protein